MRTLLIAAEFTAANAAYITGLFLLDDRASRRACSSQRGLCKKTSRPYAHIIVHIYCVEWRSMELSAIQKCAKQ